MTSRTTAGAVRKCERVGGLLNYYYREEARSWFLDIATKTRIEFFGFLGFWITPAPIHKQKPVSVKCRRPNESLRRRSVNNHRLHASDADGSFRSVLSLDRG